MDNKVSKFGYFTGVLGGLIFSIPWLLVYVFFNLSVGYLSFLTVLGIILGYKLINKNIYNDKKTRIYLLISSAIVVLLNELLFIPILATLKYDWSFSLKTFQFLYTSKEFLTAMCIDTIAALIMILIPSLLFPMDFKKKDINQSESVFFVQEVKKIFEKYNSFSKETAIDKKIIKSEIENIGLSKFKKLIYTDIMKGFFIRSKKGKWYFKNKKIKNPRLGLIISISFIIIFTSCWNLGMLGVKFFKEDYNIYNNSSGQVSEKSKLKDYKINDVFTIQMPDCMKLYTKDYSNDNVETYYYQYVSQNVYKSNIEVIEMYYHPNYNINDNYEQFKSFFKDSLSKYEILAQEDKIIKDNKIMYFKLNNYGNNLNRFVNTYFVPFSNDLLEIHIHINRDNYNVNDDKESDKIIESINKINDI